MTDPITTTVTWDDLIGQHDDELADLQDAYAEVRDLAEEEYGDGALDAPVPSEPSAVPDDRMDLYVYQRQAAQYDEAAKSIQNRQHVLGELREQFGGGAFAIKMLTGAETMDIETQLRMEAQQRDAAIDTIQVRRNSLTVDAATVDAPEGVPREDGSPVPSACPNPLTLALWEQVQRYNNAGATDFRPEGCGDATSPATGASSATPTTSGGATTPSSSTDG